MLDGHTKQPSEPVRLDLSVDVARGLRDIRVYSR